MRKIYIFTLMLLVSVVGSSVQAETYLLLNGDSVEGDVVRVEQNRIVLKTENGISSLHIDEFEYETKKALIT